MTDAVREYQAKRNMDDGRPKDWVWGKDADAAIAALEEKLKKLELMGDHLDEKWSQAFDGFLKEAQRVKGDALARAEAAEADSKRLRGLVLKFAAQLIEANVWDAGGWTPEIMAELDPADLALREASHETP